MQLASESTKSCLLCWHYGKFFAHLYYAKSYATQAYQGAMAPHFKTLHRNSILVLQWKNIKLELCLVLLAFFSYGYYVNNLRYVAESRLF